MLYASAHLAIIMPELSKLKLQSCQPAVELDGDLVQQYLDKVQDQMHAILN
jgi:hypothetical protein